MDDKHSLIANIEISEDEEVEHELSKKRVHFVYPKFKSNEDNLPSAQLTNDDGVNSVIESTYQPEIDILTGEMPTNIPSSYKTVAWLSCLFGCIPFSIAAVLKSRKVSKLIAKGDLKNAKVQSEVTVKLASLAIIFGIILIVFFIIVYLLRKYF
ncbi:uncharacterized protein LOC105847685 [Hydra vulgaris]|uniref:uncharacterized protein LOC105847685 n=1 Tax=Hydra vulgaris TaxID=6087 RepID=UPI000640EE2F|nr:uncharacterized protein LOC105847685 [Hydra vulgaris]